MVLYLSEADIRAVLTMDVALEQVERAFTARAKGEAVDVARVRTRMPGAHLHILQAGAPELNTVGYKAYYIKPDKSRSSLVNLFDREEGNLEAILEADWMGMMRTGAATGVAAKYLAKKNARVLGLFGYGRHAKTQLEAVSRVRPLSEVKVFGRNTERVQAFCAEMGPRLKLNVRPAASREETVRGSDMIVVMTRASEPLFDGRWLEPGQFVAAAGSNALDRREVDLETVKRANPVVVDSRDVAENECGDLLPAWEAGLIDWRTLPDLGDIIIGRHRGRAAGNDGEQQVILYESHGMGLQDIYTGARVLQLARERGLGTGLPIG
ncbi:MAG TPA: ornithine cyclodeaminase family protein [Burkholderiales bacterium]|jgi:ornithine cyclodeaminase